jgi:FKBP-type peptidyl-prolyl cis-trans isomerase FkpA
MKQFFKSKCLSAAMLGLVLSLSACGGGSDKAVTPVPDTSGSAQVTTLQTTDTVLGTGATAAAGQRITVHYTGWLYDVKAADKKGAKFDSSVDRGQVFSFTLGLGSVIKGWDQGVAGMRVGGKRTLIIPSSLGYGANAQGSIPANAALVFDVQLISVP